MRRQQAAAIPSGNFSTPAGRTLNIDISQRCKYSIIPVCIDMETPNEIKKILEKLEASGFEGFLVGGCVRDLLRGKEPEDWDIATSAKPEEIQKIFPDNFSENKFGTVTVLTGSKNEKLKEVEITPYRADAKYSDKRHPDEVKFVKNIKDDLSRRDFTINAMAISETKGKKAEIKIIDPFKGEKDLKAKIIRAVGEAEERFSEDALRMMRAVRLAVCLGFKIEKNTGAAIRKNAKWLEVISKERIRDEFVKIIMSDSADTGVEMLRELGLLQYIAPEIEEGYGVGQNKHHIYDCYEHSLLSLKYAAKKKFNMHVRMAVLLHDVGKPRVKRGEGADSTFYNHEVVGAKMAKEILERLKFPSKDVEKITKLVRFHLFYYNVGEVTESSVRRLVGRVGIENMNELLEVRMSDRIGSGVPKAEPYKLRHLKYIIDKVSQSPISAKALKINGNEVMDILKIQAGPKVGWILEILLGEVLADTDKNQKEILEKSVKELGSLTEKELGVMAKEAKEDREKIETKKDEMTKAKYWVT